MEEKNHMMKGGQKTDTETKIQYAIIIALVLLVAFNAYRVYGPNSSTGSAVDTGLTGIATVSALDILPKGVPEVYGKELGVSFDDVSASNPQLADATMAKLSKYEDLQLNSEKLNRYIRIGSSISCEYCCGAQAIVFSNGERACGCAHSYAMRGLIKYLLTEHADMTDAQILEEIGKWKTLFFPGVHQQKAAVLKDQGVDISSYINLASNLYRGAEQGQAQGGQMVGGC